MHRIMCAASSCDDLLARHYDAMYGTVRTPIGDVDFYRDLAVASGGEVLELGCGTGRIVLPIARAGVECVGLEPSMAMLDVLRGKSPPANLELVCSPIEQLDLHGRRFSLITAPYRALSHLLDVDAQLTALERIRRHLAPGGMFAFDLFDPKLDRLAIVDEPESLGTTFLSDGIETRCHHSVRRDHARQVMHIRFRFEGGPPGSEGTTEFDLRWYHRYEIQHLLARTGFRSVRIFGGFDRRPWASGGETVVVTC